MDSFEQLQAQYKQFQADVTQAKEDADAWEDKVVAAKKDYETVLASIDQKQKDMSEKAAEHVNKVADQIILNVGGTLFTTTKQTLLRVKDAYFAGMLESGHWKPQNDGTYFVDANPKYFAIILDYLRYGELEMRGLTPKQIRMLQVELDYFFPNLVVRLCTGYTKELKLWLGNHFDASRLLWRGSRDGFTAKTFHSHCDNEGATLTVIESVDGYIFGGYNPNSWGQANQVDCSTAFIFTLKNPHDIPPTQYFPPKGFQGNLVLDDPQFGPSFGPRGNFGQQVGFGGQKQSGFGHNTESTGDLVVFSPMGQCYTNLSCFVDTTHRGGGTFTGKKPFVVKEIEVYAV